MMKFLNVAEKNDAAKNIASHLSRGTSRRREGLSQYNKIYEFEADVFGQRAQMVMTSVSGHLLSLEFVGAYKHWNSCSPLVLFDAPVFKYCPDNYEKIKKTLEREIRSCQGLIIWTDCDREGENIGFEIIEVCTAVRNNLRIYRAKFSEITGISVKRALDNLEQPNKNISDAVDVRQELDLRIGAAFTRFQTLRLKRVFPNQLSDSLISYGSCQFPTLGFVVERYRAVENFIPEPFWKIKVNHTMNNLSVDFTWSRGRLFDEHACRVLHDICTEAGRAAVTEVHTKPKSKWRPLPLDTVELEKLASRKLKISAKETMKIAEKLYTQGFISYPRTETNEYPKEMDLAQLVGYQTVDRNWGGFAQGILDNGGPNPRQGNKSDKAHPPIHPTKHAPGLSGNEQRVYEFIVRSFLACCSKDAQGQETTVAIDVGSEKFTANGLMITARNYLEVYPYDKWSSKEIHVYQNGQVFTPTSIDMLDGSTSPPNLLTEADLIALMEKHGIGTDATHAEHIETIKARSYVALADGVHFVPGLLGMGLVEGYDAMGLAVAKPDLRAQLESDLKDISEGRKQPQVVLAEQIAKYKEVYTVVTAEALKIDAALAQRFNEPANNFTAGESVIPADLPPVLKCPKCNMDMVVRKKRDSDDLYIGCISFPQCKNAVWFPNSLVRSVEVLQESCPDCGPSYKKLKFHWKNNSINHLYPHPYIGCIGGCDLTFLEILQINLSSVKVNQTRPNSGTRPINNDTGQNHTDIGQVNNRQQHNTSTRQQANTNQNRQQINTNTSSNRQQNNTNPRQQATTNQNRQQTNTNQQQSSSNTGQQDNWQQSNTSVWQQNSNSNRNTVPSRVNTVAPMIPPASRNNPSSDDNNVTCGCNKPAILLTVKKQNANFGKKFYKCPIGKENNGCDFFLWAPETTETTANVPFDTPPSSNWGVPSNDQPLSNTWGVPSQNVSSSGWGIGRSSQDFPGNDDGVMCNCNLPCKKITVHKEGPNKGRPFYGCTKEFNARCNFFQWGDSANDTIQWGGGTGSNTEASSRGRGGFRGGRGARGRGAARGGAAAAPGGARSVRKCSNCRQEGHTRNRCPDLN